MKNVLFICSRNRLRSPTAETVFAARADLTVTSAGTATDAACTVDSELIEWADEIFVMEQHHKATLANRFGQSLTGRRLVVLGIPDRFTFMDPKLIRMLIKKLTPLLGPMSEHDDTHASR